MPIRYSVSKTGTRLTYTYSGFEPSKYLEGQIVRLMPNPDGTWSGSSIKLIDKGFPENLLIWLKNLDLIKTMKENLFSSYTYTVKRILGVPNSYSIEFNNNIKDANEEIGSTISGGNISITIKIPNIGEISADINLKNMTRSIDIAPKEFYDINISTSPYTESMTSKTTTVSETIERQIFYSISVSGIGDVSQGDFCNPVTITEVQGTLENRTITRIEFIERTFRPYYMFVDRVDFSEITFCEYFNTKVLFNKDCVIAKLEYIMGQGCSIFGITFLEIHT